MAHRSLVASIAACAVAMAILAFPVPALAQQAAAYTNALDSQSDVSSWYLSDYWGQWAVDNSPIEGHNSPASLNCNNGSQLEYYYNDMYFQTSPIDIQGMSSPSITWWCLTDLPDPNNNYVDRYLYLFDESFNAFFFYSIGESGFDLNCGTDGQWHQHTIQIPQEIQDFGNVILYAGTYYEFYDDGAYQGWFTDDLQILVADITPPDPIGDLAAGGETLTTVDVTWSAPHDDDVSGVVDSYDLRYSLTPINGANFDSATTVAGEPNPDFEGTHHTKTVTNLLEDTTYYFAIRSTDIAGNLSPVSNVASVTTLAPPPPPAAPAPPPSTFGPPEETKDILPCAAGTNAAPTGLLALAGLIALAALARALRK